MKNNLTKIKRKYICLKKLSFFFSSLVIRKKLEINQLRIKENEILEFVTGTREFAIKSIYQLFKRIEIKI